MKHISSSPHFLFQCIVVLMAITVTGCNSNGGQSANVKLDIIPERPRVIYTSFTDVNGNEIEGSWFKMRYKIDNQSQFTLIIRQFILRICARTTGADDSPNVSSVPLSPFDPDKDSENIPLKAQVTINNKTTLVAEFKPSNSQGAIPFLGRNHCPNGTASESTIDASQYDQEGNREGQRDDEGEVGIVKPLKVFHVLLPGENTDQDKHYEVDDKVLTFEFLFHGLSVEQEEPINQYRLELEPVGYFSTITLGDDPGNYHDAETAAYNNPASTYFSLRKRFYLRNR